MKKLFICVIIIFSYRSISLEAAIGSSGFMYSEVTVCDTTAMPGDTIMVEILTSDVTGLGITSCEITLTFNPDFLEALEAKEGILITPDWIMCSNPMFGEIRIALAGVEELAGAGSIVIVPFIVNSDALPRDSSIINFSHFMFNEDTTLASTSNGKISVLALEGHCRYWSNSTGIVDVKMELSGNRYDTVLTDNDGHYGFCVEKGESCMVMPGKENVGRDNAISAYDGALILKDIIKTDTLTGNECIAGDVSGNGDITSYDAALVLKYSVGIIEHFPAGDWVFQPDSESCPGIDSNILNEDYTAVLYGDVSGNYLSKGKGNNYPRDTVLIKIRDIVPNGDTVNIIVRAEGITGQEIISCDMEVIFDSTLLRVLNVRTGSVISSEWLSESRVSGGKVDAALAGTKGITGDGSLLEITFIKNAEQPVDKTVLHFNEFAFNEGKVLAKMEDGVLSLGSGIKGLSPEEISLKISGVLSVNPPVITYSLPARARISLNIYDISGRVVSSLINREQGAGTYNMGVDTKDLSSGIYFVELLSGSYRKAEKFVLMK